MRLNHKQGTAGKMPHLPSSNPAARCLPALAPAYGEIDLIVKNGGMILFVEVKYRKTNGSAARHTAFLRPNY